MKANLLILFLIFPFIASIASIDNQRREQLVIRSVMDKNIPRLFSLSVSPITAFIENKTIEVHFNVKLENGTIHIINANQYVVYSTFCDNESITIDLTDQPIGEYKLEIHIDGKIYEGRFALE